MTFCMIWMGINMNFDKIICQINKANTILIVTHVSPDGDAIGSSFALKFMLESMGKTAFVYLKKPKDKIYHFIQSDNITSTADISYDIVIALDCGDYGRISCDRKIQPDINIDHHHTNDMFAKLNYVDASASATGEIIFFLIREMGISLTPQIASCLYCAIATDTGRFMYGNTTKNVFAIMQILYETGIDLAMLNKQLFDTFTLANLTAKAQCMKSLRLYCENRVCVALMSLSDIQKYSLTDMDLDGLASIPRSVEGVIFGVFIRERENGILKVGLRSTGEYDVSKIAGTFGGGGHKNASGLTYHGSVENMLKELLPKLEVELDERNL